MVHHVVAAYVTTSNLATFQMGEQDCVLGDDPEVGAAPLTATSTAIDIGMQGMPPSYENHISGTTTTTCADESQLQRQSGMYVSNA